MSNAIILAAGLGSRFGEITKEQSKTLLCVGKQPLLERTIEFLHEIGISEIHVVTGHMAEQFDYLHEKYGVNLIYNPKYKEYNNRYSMYLALSHFGDTYVIDGDVGLVHNVLRSHSDSTYYVVRRDSESAEWIPILDSSGCVEAMEVSNAPEPSLLGISYWTMQDAKLIKDEFAKFISSSDLENSKGYWDDIPVTLLDRLNVRVYEIDSKEAVEIDNEAEYYKLKQEILTLEEREENYR